MKIKNFAQNKTETSRLIPQRMNNCVLVEDESKNVNFTEEGKWDSADQLPTFMLIITLCMPLSQGFQTFWLLRGWKEAISLVRGCLKPRTAHEHCRCLTLMKMITLFPT